MVLAVPAGVWADRWDRKRILIASDAVRLVTQAIAAVLLLTGTAEVAHLVVLAAVFGAADAFFAPGVQRPAADHGGPGQHPARQRPARPDLLARRTSSARWWPAS